MHDVLQKPAPRRHPPARSRPARFPRLARLGRISWRAILLLFWTIAGTVALTFTSLDEAIVESVASRRLGAQVEIGAIDWEPTRNGVHFSEVRVTVTESAEPLVTVGGLFARFGQDSFEVAVIEVHELELILNERSDGTFDHDALDRGDERVTNVPDVFIVSGKVELRGRGPLNQRLDRVLAKGVPRTLNPSFVRIESEGNTDLRVTGSATLAGFFSFDSDAEVRSGALVRASAAPSGGYWLDVADLRDRLAPAARDWLAANAIDGAVRPQIEIERVGGRLRTSVTSDLTDCAATLEAFPVAVEQVAGTITLADGVLSLDGLRGVAQASGKGAGGAEVTIRGTIEDLFGDPSSRATVRIEGATVDDELRAALRLDPVGAEMLEAFAPEGRFSVLATLEKEAREEKPRLTLDLDLEDLALVFHGFEDEAGERRGLPVRVERVRGSVHAAAEESSFEHVTGFTRGGARVEASARSRGESVTGQVLAERAVVDAELLDAITQAAGPRARELIDELALTGSFDASARFASDSKAMEPELSILLVPRRARIEPRFFPLPVEFVAGSVLLERERVRLEGLHAPLRGGTLRVDGEIAVAAAEDGAGAPPLSIRLSASGVELGKELVRACVALGSPRLDDLLASIAPGGRFDLDLGLVRAQAGGPLDLRLRLEPKGLAVASDDGSLAIRDLGGVVELSRKADGPWEIDLESGGGLRGACLDGSVTLRGRASGDALHGLKVVGDRLRAGEEMRAALQPLAPELAETLATHRVDGRVRVACVLEERDGELVPARIDVEPDASDVLAGVEERGVVVEPPWLGLPLRWLDGALHADPGSGTVTFERVIGRLGDAHLVVHSGSFTADETGVAVALSADIDLLPFGQWIELVFGRERRRAMAPYGPLGRTHVSIRNLALHAPPGGSAIDSLSGSGDLGFSGWTFYTRGPLQNLTGRLEILDFGIARESGGIADVRADARLSDVTLEAGGLRLSDIEADVVLADGRLSLPWLSAEYAGGRLLPERNHLTITLLDLLPFDGRFELVAGDVSRLLGDEVARMRALTGRVDAEVGFRGEALPFLRGEGVTRLEAAGALDIRDAKLWSIPLFDRLNTLAVLPLIGADEEAEPPRWTRGKLDFALQGVYVQLTGVELEGEPIVLRGHGTLGPERLVMNLVPEVKTGWGIVRRVPLVGWAAGLLLTIVEREVGSFRFQGPYGDPQVEWDPVSFVPRPDLDIELERPRTSSRPLPRPQRF